MINYLLMFTIVYNNVYNSYNFDSNHQLVIADICTPCTKVARYVILAAISTKKHFYRTI